jgi:phosphoribosylformimino-5-aminoimidazole carboxamide ribotide isomerase
MLAGMNIEATAQLARSIHIPVIASGGIRSLDDIRALGQIVDDGVVGAVTGRAIYEGTLDFAEAQKIAEQF